MSDVWHELARRFRAASGRWPALRHVLVENTEAAPIDPPEFERVGRLVLKEHRYESLSPADRALWDRYRDQEAPFCGPEVARLRSELAPVVRSVHDYRRGVEHYFHGAPAGHEAPSWRDLVDLAHLGAKLAVDAGHIEPLPPHDPVRFESQALQEAAVWMELVYRLARERRPGFLLSVRDRGATCRVRLPEVLIATTLPCDVFSASAEAAELLAGAVGPAAPASAALAPRMPAASSSTGVSCAPQIHALQGGAMRDEQENVGRGPVPTFPCPQCQHEYAIHPRFGVCPNCGHGRWRAGPRGRYQNTDFDRLLRPDGKLAEEVCALYGIDPAKVDAAARRPVMEAISCRGCGTMFPANARYCPACHHWRWKGVIRIAGLGPDGTCTKSAGWVCLDHNAFFEGGTFPDPSTIAGLYGLTPALSGDRPDPASSGAASTGTTAADPPAPEAGPDGSSARTTSPTTAPEAMNPGTRKPPGVPRRDADTIGYEAIADALLHENQAGPAKLVRYMADKGSADWPDVVEACCREDASEWAVKSLSQRTNNALAALEGPLAPTARRLRFRFVGYRVVKAIGPP